MLTILWVIYAMIVIGLWRKGLGVKVPVALFSVDIIAFTVEWMTSQHPTDGSVGVQVAALIVHFVVLVGICGYAIRNRKGEGDSAT